VRTPSRRTYALAAAWLAFMAGLLVGGEVEDAGSVAIGAVAGAALVFLGFAAAWRSRPLSQTDHPKPLRLAGLSLLVGVALGFVNLLMNLAIAASASPLRALLFERMTTLRPVIGVVASPLVEEIAVRLFLMSALAWFVQRVTGRADLAFAVALVGSSLVFALLHLDRPMPSSASLANYYRTALVVKYTLAGLPLGWIFWRWGLPYAILCHVAANAAHLVLQKMFV
jgi:membrane protease YdiL (CAAX protease family)